MSKEYSPYFSYTLQPATEEDPTPHCIKTEPYDLGQCNWGGTKNRFAHEQPKLKLYHDGPAISYTEGKGFPTGNNPYGGYYPVASLTEYKPPVQILNNGNFECSEPSFDGPINSYNPCKSLEIKCCDPKSSCTFETCNQPDPRFGMAESIYKMYPKTYKKYQTQNWWHNLASKDFINNGSYEYTDKQEWGTAPWSLGEYAAPRLCPGDSHEEWRTAEDRCSGEYKSCNNLFNNMTRRKSLL